MMRYGTRFAFLAALALLAGAVAQAEAAIDIDGDLEDWGIKINSSGSLVYDSVAYDGYTGTLTGDYSGVSDDTWYGGYKIWYHLEDTDDGSNDYPVGPLYGGQNYDAEVLVVAPTPSTLYIGIASGQRPDNGASDPDEAYYGPGDIAILTDGVTYGLYGIEVGGGPGGLSGTAVPDMLDEDDSAYTYELFTSGYTDYPVEHAGEDAGSLWRTPDLDDWRVRGGWPTQLEYAKLAVSDHVGDADYTFNFKEVTADVGGGTAPLAQHSIIELSIPMDLFDGDVKEIRWGPACANDRVLVVQLSSTPPIPEPGSLVVWALLALSSGGCGWWRWRLRRHKGAA